MRARSLMLLAVLTMVAALIVVLASLHYAQRLEPSTIPHAPIEQTNTKGSSAVKALACGELKCLYGGQVASIWSSMKTYSTRSSRARSYVEWLLRVGLAKLSEPRVEGSGYWKIVTVPIYWSWRNFEPPIPNASLVKLTRITLPYAGSPAPW